MEIGIATVDEGVAFVDVIPVSVDNTTVVCIGPFVVDPGAESDGAGVIGALLENVDAAVPVVPIDADDTVCISPMDIDIAVTRAVCAVVDNVEVSTDAMVDTEEEEAEASVDKR